MIIDFLLQVVFILSIISLFLLGCYMLWLGKELQKNQDELFVLRLAEEKFQQIDEAVLRIKLNLPAGLKNKELQIKLEEIDNWAKEKKEEVQKWAEEKLRHIREIYK